MDRTPKPGEFYRHFKNKMYQIVAVAKHSETGELLVVYQALYGDYSVYARPLSMFVSEVDHEKYPQIKQKYRFEKVTFSEEMAPQQAEPGETKLGEGVRQAEPQTSRTEVREAAQGAAPQQAPRELSPLLLPFVEAQDYDEKLEILAAMRGKVGQEDLDVLYVALDLPSGSGDLKSQLDSIENYLVMRKKFDGNRLR